MKALFLTSLFVMSFSAMAVENFGCSAGGGLGDILCLGAKHRAKKCAILQCKMSGYKNCEVLDVSWYSTYMSPYTSCQASAIVQGSYED